MVEPLTTRPMLQYESNEEISIKRGELTLNIQMKRLHRGEENSNVFKIVATKCESTEY